MSTFILRAPKISVAYLSRSPHSVVSDSQCQVSLVECQQYAAIIVSEQSRLAGRTDSTGDRINNVLEFLQDDPLVQSIVSKDSHGDGQTRKDIFAECGSFVPTVIKKTRNVAVSATDSCPRKILRSRRTPLQQSGDRQPAFENRYHQLPYKSSLSQKDLQDPVSLHYLLEQCHLLRTSLPTPIRSPSQPPLPSTREVKGDIIVCIRDEIKPPVENLVRAYAVSAELLRHTMDYFRTILAHTTEKQEQDGIQISLYVQKDLWEWLLHLAKIQYRQTRDPLPPIQTSLALPLFSTAVLLGMTEGREICLRYLKQIWPQAIHERDRSLEHVTETGVEALAQEVNPDYVELLTDHSDWIVERFYDIWVQDIFQQAVTDKPAFFPYGTAKDVFLCTYCRKWMNGELSTVLACCNKMVVRKEDGRMGAVHSQSSEQGFRVRREELKKELGTWRAVFWSLYGLLNVLKCAECGEVFQLAEISHCRYHPCQAERCKEKAYDVFVYPCCQRLVSRIDEQKSTGCGFKDHRVDAAALNASDKLRHQRLLSFQRFMWISPRKSAETLSDPDNPAFLTDKIKTAAQELVATSWDSAKPLWSNQDCLRQEEKKSMKMLREYFRNIGKPPSRTTLDESQTVTKEANSDEPPETAKPVPPVPPVPPFPDSRENSIKEPTSSRQMSAKLGEQAGRITALYKGGPFSGRNRYVPNLTLPAYRGVFTRIHDEWRTAVEVLIAAEQNTRPAASPDMSDTKMKTSQLAHLATRKLKVQKIPLRKVTQPLKPPKNEQRTGSGRLEVGSGRQSAVTMKLSKLKRIAEPLNRQRVRPGKKSKKLTRKGRTSKGGWDGGGDLLESSEENEEDGNDSRVDEGRLDTVSDSVDYLTCPTSMCRSQTFPEILSDRSRSHDDPVIEMMQSMPTESFAARSDSKSTAGSVPEYALKLVKKLRRLEPLPEYTPEQNAIISQRFTERIQGFLQKTATAREQILATTWKRLQQKEEKKRERKKALLQFSTASEAKRFNCRLIRLFRFLKAHHTDAFTQPQSLVGERVRELATRQAFTDRCMAEVEKVWRRKARKLLVKTFPFNTSYAYLLSESEKAPGMV